MMLEREREGVMITLVGQIQLTTSKSWESCSHGKVKVDKGLRPRFFSFLSHNQNEEEWEPQKKTSPTCVYTRAFPHLPKEDRRNKREQHGRLLRDQLVLLDHWQ